MPTRSRLAPRVDRPTGTWRERAAEALQRRADELWDAYDEFDDEGDESAREDALSDASRARAYEEAAYALLSEQAIWDELRRHVRRRDRFDLSVLVGRVFARLGWW